MKTTHNISTTTNNNKQNAMSILKLILEEFMNYNHLFLIDKL